MRSAEAKCMVAAVAAMATFAAAGADVVKSLAGEWRVTGKNLAGMVRLPGTLADAKLGRHKTVADWEADAERPSKGALTREYQYRGKAVYEREITLTEEEARYPLELVMERVMLHSELAIDGAAVGSCDSLAVEHVYPIPQRLTTPGRHTIQLTLDNSNRYNFSEWAHSYGRGLRRRRAMCAWRGGRQAYNSKALVVVRLLSSRLGHPLTAKALTLSN